MPLHNSVSVPAHELINEETNVADKEAELRDVGYHLLFTSTCNTKR